MRRLGASEEDAPKLADSLPSWEPFPEVPQALAEVRERGWKIAILSNSDPPQIEASKARIGVPFDETIVAGAIGSYKPAHRHWEGVLVAHGRRPRAARARRREPLPRRRSRRTSSVLPFVWINRVGESATCRRAELRDLTGASPEVLDELVSGLGIRDPTRPARRRACTSTTSRVCTARRRIRRPTWRSSGRTTISTATSGSRRTTPA
jgi:hypothetical protein